MRPPRAGAAAALLIGLHALCSAGVAWPARAETAGAWPDGYVTRLQAQALVHTLNGTILSARLATLALETWCRDHNLSGPAEPKIVARLASRDDKPATAEQRQRLEVGPEEPVKYRRVQLVCGERVLSEADNWYVPGRLTPEMNRLLETTDTPFGRAVIALKPSRKTFAAKVLWWPLPPGWETQPNPPASGSGMLAIPESLFEHRALLYTESGKPFSEVHEVYKRGLLAFPLPKP